MTGSILVLNAGSSSLKFALYRREASLQLQLKGAASRLGSRQPRLHAKIGERILKDETLDGPLSPVAAANRVLDWLLRDDFLVDLEAVGHRIVHGGSVFSAPTVLDADALRALTNFVPLAPLHQPHNLEIATLTASRLPNVRQIGCFDTAFHVTCSPLARLYGLPRELSDDGIVAYGFHGLSYAYLSGILKAEDGDRAGGKAIVAHLGSGASMCAMDGGCSVATTMGFSALDGLLMGTRCGSLDPGVVLHLLQEKNMTPEAIATLLYERSGLLGVSGVSSDMLRLLQSSAPSARQAVDLFVYRAASAIGSLAATLNGLDTFVFTAGIGENSPEIRARICRASRWLGLDIDHKLNAENASTISTRESRVSVRVIPTDEEQAVATAVTEIIEPASRTA